MQLSLELVRFVKTVLATSTLLIIWVRVHSLVRNDMVFASLLYC